MSMLKAKMQMSTIGLDVDAHEFRAVQLIKAGDELKTLAWALFPRQDQQRVTGSMPDIEELKWAHALLGQRGFVGDMISIVPSTAHCSSHLLELPPPESGAPIDQLARMEIARERRGSPTDFEFAQWALPAMGRTRSTLAVACPRDVIDSTVNQYEQGGFIPAGIDLMELAICRGHSEHSVKDTGHNDINASLHIGWTSSLAILTMGDTVVYVRRVERGASRVWESLIDRYKLDDASAQSVLDGIESKEPSESMVKLRRAVWAGLASDLANELDVAIAYVSHLYRMAPLGIIRLTGYGSQSQVVIEQLDKVIGIPVVHEIPSSLIQAMGAGPQSVPTAGRLAVAYGLAARFDQ